MSKQKAIFITRLITYFIFSLALPIAYLIWKFQLFRRVSKVSIGGWGLVLIIFLAVYFWKLISAARKGLKFGMTRQVLNGLCGITLPLAISYLVLWWLSGNIQELIDFLLVLTICETVAIPINPIPKWQFDNNKEVTEMSIMSIVEKFKK